MILWFATISVILVAIVFRSGAVDYRTVAIGALLPWLDALFGGPRVLHSLLGVAAVLTIVMLVTSRRRLVRRRVLGIPIGLLCHLVLDGTFTDTTAFWWPAAGWAFADGQVPELRHLRLSLILEFVGVVATWWAWRLFGLDRSAARDRFVREGRLDVPI